MLPKPPNPEQAQPNLTMRGVCPEQGSSTHLSTCSSGPASTCSLGFSQHRAGLQNGNFCHFWQAHPLPQPGTHGSRQIRKMLMSASCSKGQGATAWEKPVGSQLSQHSPALLGHPHPEWLGCTKSPCPAQQTQPCRVFNQPEKSSSRFHAELNIRLQRKHILSLIKNKSGCMKTNKRRTA